MKTFKIEKTEKNQNWVNENLDPRDFTTNDSHIVITYFEEFQKEDILAALPKCYVVSWESGRGMRYADGTERGAELIENAIKFESREEAQEYIDNNCGDHCSTEELH